MKIPFNKPYVTKKNLQYMEEALFTTQLVGDGPFTKKCHDYFQIKSQKALLTHSCTGAMEMMALLLNLKEGDEVIMPSYTFSSTANAFVLRGAVPVFIDIRPDTLNIDESLVECAITSKTKAIMVMHYAGVGCEMDGILAIAKKHNLIVLEDAAQGIHAYYKGQELGTIADMGSYSFHGTKNIVCGEGGVLLINNTTYIDDAEIIREKGTDRSQFLKGQVDKYTWQSVGSSFLPSDITAAFLYSQLQDADFITQERLKIWNYYHKALESLEKKGFLRRQIIPESCQHNAHMYYVILDEKINRTNVLASLKETGVGATYHYIALHSSPAGIKYGRTSGSMKHTDDLSNRLVRLPLWIGLREESLNYVVDTLATILVNK